jgi:hypothetical protein
MSARARRKSHQLVGWIVLLVLLAAGLLLGTESTLVLTRDRNGAVTAVNAWRLLGRLPLVWRTAENVREARLQEVALSQREAGSSANRDAFGMLGRREELVISGTTQIPYPYHEDLSLIRSFLKTPANRRAEVHHPIDVRRQVASAVLLAVVTLSVVGWAWERATGRAAVVSPRRVKPLPPAVGTTLFLTGIVIVFWFFQAGHRVFGPLATKKVALLFAASQGDDAGGVSEATRRGVFLDARDDQGRTALMVAARAGARRACRELLTAGAHPDLQDLEGRTALIVALDAEHAEVAGDLLDAAADTGAADINGRTALHHAAEMRDPSVLKRLIASGVDVDQPDVHGWTPLFFAAAGGTAESVRSLLAAGADPRRKLPDGRAPRDLAFADPAVGPVLDSVARVAEAPLATRPGASR